MDDSQILALYFSRAEAAIQETDRKYGRYCYRIAYSILDSRQDSEESVNDTYLSAWNSIPPRKPTRLSTYLGKLTRNISIDRWRKCSAQKRGSGEVALALDELTECVNAIPEGSDYKDYLNPESVTVRTHCKLEESLKDAKPGEKFQFVRTGFFTPDSKNPGVYNRVVTLRDSFKPAK